MYVNELELNQFRNFKHLKLKLHPNLNIIVGNNAQGKTNLLESIYVGCFGKSFRTNNDKDLILADAQYNHARFNIQKRHTDINIEYRIHHQLNKEIKINNNSIKKLSEILGNIYVVLFSPEDLELVKGSPSIRRNFINRELSNINLKYCGLLIEYKTILKQRNNILKKGEINDAMLEIFTEQLVDKGAQIIIYREKFIQKINKISHKIHRILSSDQENLTIEYLSNIHLEKTMNYDRIKESFYKKIKSKESREKQLGYTLVGPHRDDFDLFINEREVKKFGSQGQQRTAALSLKLSEIELIKDETGEYPILLLDDVFSELDLSRQKSLLNIFRKTQTIITSTAFDEVLKDKVLKYKLIHIKNGKSVGGLHE